VADSAALTLPTPLARKFALYVVGFFVTIGLALAPLLANAEPGTLLGLFPAFLRLTLIPVSGLVMGGIALAVQLYRGSSIPKARIRRRFAALAAFTGLALAALVVLLNLLIVDVPLAAAGSSTRVLIGFQRSPDCGCLAKASTLQCLAELGPENPLAVDSCWPSRTRSELWLTFVYLATIGGLGGLVGLVVLQEAAKRPPRPKKRAAPASPPP